jgi:hypothetical protein
MILNMTLESGKLYQWIPPDALFPSMSLLLMRNELPTHSKFTRSD